MHSVRSRYGLRSGKRGRNNAETSGLTAGSGLAVPCPKPFFPVFFAILRENVTAGVAFPGAKDDNAVGGSEVFNATPRADNPTLESDMFSRKSGSLTTCARTQAMIRRWAGSKTARQPNAAYQRVVGLAAFLERDSHV